MRLTLRTLLCSAVLAASATTGFVYASGPVPGGDTCAGSGPSCNCAWWDIVCFFNCPCP